MKCWVNGEAVRWPNAAFFMFADRQRPGVSEMRPFLVSSPDIFTIHMQLGIFNSDGPHFFSLESPLNKRDMNGSFLSL